MLIYNFNCSSVISDGYLIIINNRAPEMTSLEEYLKDAGFSDVNLELKEESREIISQWLPGSGAEDFVVSAEVKAKKL